MTISICDDEIYFASKLRQLLDEYCSLKGICLSILTFSNGEEFFSSGQVSDIILMDIKLPGTDGMETIQQLRNLGNDSQVIFITAYQEYVFQAFDVDAVHYILKPVTAKKLFPVLDKAIKRASGNEKMLLITNGTSAFRILIKDIIYCEALNHQITVHTLTDQYQFFGTLDALQNKLDERFFRSHRSYLVNMYFVIYKEPGFAIMSGGDKILIARRKQQEFTKQLLEVCRKGLI